MINSTADGVCISDLEEFPWIEIAATGWIQAIEISITSFRGKLECDAIFPPIRPGGEYTFSERIDRCYSKPE